MWKDLTFEFNGVTYFASGKVYPEPSKFGIQEGRVSKLSICIGNTFDANHEIYNYDRGLDFDQTPEGLVDFAVSQLEARK